MTALCRCGAKPGAPTHSVICPDSKSPDLLGPGIRRRPKGHAMSNVHTDNCDPEFGCDENCTAPLPPCTCGGVSADFGRGYDTGIAAAYRGEQNRINAVVLQYVIGLPGRIKTCRTTNGLSLRDAATQTGLSAMTLSRIENGADYDVESLVALAAWLDKWTPRQAAVFYDKGGVVPPGTTWVRNDTGKDVQVRPA